MLRNFHKFVAEIWAEGTNYYYAIGLIRRVHLENARATVRFQGELWMHILDPYPINFRLSKDKRRSALYAFLFCFVGLLGPYLVLEAVPNILDREPFWPESRAVAIGNAIALPVFMATAALAFVGYIVPAKKRFYHTRWWFVGIWAFFLCFFIVKDARWLPGNVLVQMHTFIQAPIFAALVIGVLPHLAFDVKGRWIYRFLAFGSAGFYLWAACQDRFWEHFPW